MNLKKEFEDRVLESRESKREGGLLHHYDRLFIYADDRINILEAVIEEADRINILEAVIEEAIKAAVSDH